MKGRGAAGLVVLFCHHAIGDVLFFRNEVDQFTPLVVDTGDDLAGPVKRSVLFAILQRPLPDLAGLDRRP
jgi:hypothetical protein